MISFFKEEKKIGRYFITQMAKTTKVSSTIVFLHHTQFNQLNHLQRLAEPYNNQKLEGNQCILQM